MSLIFHDGMGHYTNVAQKWEGASLGNLSITTGGRAGGKRLVKGSTIDGNTYAHKIIPVAKSTLIAGMAYTQSAVQVTTPIIMSFMSGTTHQVQLGVDPDGRVVVGRGNGFGTILAQSDVNTIRGGVANFYEIKATFSTTIGRVIVRLNGNALIDTGASEDTDPAATGDADRLRVAGGAAGSSIDRYWQDVYFCDTDGAENNDFLGDVTSPTILPNGDGATLDWSLSSGVSHYQLIDEVPPDTSDYIYSDNVGDIDLVTLTNLTQATGDIKAVSIRIFASKNDGGSTVLNSSPKGVSR